MGYKGHGRIRPVHLSGLEKRYRELAGELRYCIRYDPDNIVRRAQLERSVELLSVALSQLNPDISVQLLRPITFRPPSTVSSQEVTRAILSTLRLAPNGLTVDSLVGAVTNRFQKGITDEYQIRSLLTRIHRMVNSLAKRQVIKQHEGRWTV